MSEDERLAVYEQERDELAAAIVKAVQGQYIGKPPPLLTGWQERAVSAVLAAGWLPPAAVQEHVDAAVSVDFLRRVLAVFAFDNCDDLWWRTDGEYAPATFFVLCNDLFEWGTADVEPIRIEDLPLLEQTAEDVRPLVPMLNCVGDLFAARKRQMRPQGASYKYIPEVLWPLFDACGPERETGLLNPKKQPVQDGEQHG